MSSGVLLGWLPQPIGGMQLVQMGFFESLFNFVTMDGGPQGRGLFRGYTYASAGYIPAGRNTVAETFLEKTDAEWLLSLDWDITYDPLSVYQLIDAADPDERPIISGVYVTYFGEGSVLRPCWMEERDGERFVPVDGFTAGEIKRLSLVGMGFTLIHRTALERIRARHTDDPWPWFGHDVIGADRTGEDLTFCNRAHEAGLSVWGHGGVLLGHTKATMLTPLDLMNPAVSSPRTIVQPDKRRVLNVGGGSKQIALPPSYAGWDHVLLDIKAGPDVDLVQDARDLSSIHSASFDAVYCSHNIEHYHAHEVPLVLAGFAAVLKPGGTVDIRCPDLAAVCGKVAEGVELDAVLYESPSGPIKARDVIYGYERQIEESGEAFYAHKTGFTETTLRRSLEDAGFVNVSVTSAALELHAVGSAPGG